jgi:ribosomal protein S18 acetylase RimI-like enzyme
MPQENLQPTREPEQGHSASALIVHQEWRFDSYSIKRVQRFEEPEFTQLIQQFFYADYPGVEWERLLSEEEKSKHQALRKEFGFPNMIRLGAYEGNKLIGWTLGWQEGDSTFYMANSGVLPEYRRKGIYQALVDRLICLLRDKGFQVIRSRHVATNSPVIIAKLRLGFVITGFELSDAFGSMVQLSYYTHLKRQKLVNVRAGLTRPDCEIASLMK